MRYYLYLFPASFQMLALSWTTTAAFMPAGHLVARAHSSRRAVRLMAVESAEATEKEVERLKAEDSEQVPNMLAHDPSLATTPLLPAGQTT